MQMYISCKTGSVYSGDKANWRDIEVTSKRPSPEHVPIVEKGNHMGWEQSPKLVRQSQEVVREQMIQAKLREIAIRALKEEGKIDDTQGTRG